MYFGHIGQFWHGMDGSNLGQFQVTPTSIVLTAKEDDGQLLQQTLLSVEDATMLLGNSHEATLVGFISVWNADVICNTKAP